MSNLFKKFAPFIFVTILGVLLHFTYQWSDNNFYVGLFSATSESTWEHLKLSFFPMVLLTIYQYLHPSKDNHLNIAKRTIGIFAAMAFIVVSFYTYIGVLGRSIDIINILIYFLGVAFGFFIEKKIKNPAFLPSAKTSALLLFGFTLLFMIFTYNIPNIGIFKSP